MKPYRPSLCLGRGICACAFALSLTALFVLTLAAASASASRALILEPTVSASTATDGSAKSLEQQQAEADGFAVTLVTAHQWELMTKTQFAAYQVLIIGDAKTCLPNPPGPVSPSPSYLAAENSKGTWEPVVMGKWIHTIAGNRILIGGDPTQHNNGPSGTRRGDILELKGIAFAGAIVGATGAYIDTSCEFEWDPPNTPVPLMDGLSTLGPHQFTAAGVEPGHVAATSICGGSIAIVASTAATTGLSDGELSNWHCSVHAFFNKFPSDWSPLALATDPSVPKVVSARDVGCAACVLLQPPFPWFQSRQPLVSGSPYILVAGSGITVHSDISLFPLVATNPVYTNHTVTATVTKNGVPVVGKTVTFTVTSGPNAVKTATAVTNAFGRASYTYPDSGGAGTDSISATFMEGTALETATTAHKSWVEGTQWYSNGKPIKKGEVVPVVTEGLLTFTIPQLATGAKCKKNDKETVTTPAEGGGTEEVTEFSLSCDGKHSPLCPPGSKLGFVARNLDWHAHLIAGSSPQREAVEHIAVEVRCSDGTVFGTFTGTLTPKMGDSFDEFDTGSGELMGPNGDTLTIAGVDKMKGPVGDEIITTGPPPAGPKLVPEGWRGEHTLGSFSGTIYPEGEEVTGCVFEFGTTLEYGLTAPCTPSPGLSEGPVEVSASTSGLTVGTTYHFRMSATNADGTTASEDETFETLPEEPTAVTGTASSLSHASATVNAAINPDGSEVEACVFAYGTTEAYDSAVPCASLPGAGDEPVAVDASIPGLPANTVYHFTVFAVNSGGVSEGADETFETPPDPPVVVTGAASAVAQSTATLNATVNPDGGVGQDSSCTFEYGTTTEYGSIAQCAPETGTGTSPVEVSASVTGLTAGTTYHFRISASNPGGDSFGGDHTFVTSTGGAGGGPIEVRSTGEYLNCQMVAKKTGKFADSQCSIPAEKKGKPSGSWEKKSVSPCVNVGKKKGLFSDAACTVKAEKKGKPSGSFELCSKTGQCAYTSVGGEATLSTPAFGKNNVTCKNNTDTGEITGNFTDTDRVTFTGCEFLGLPCQSAGPNSTPSGKAGVIVTNLLDSKLVGFPEKYTVINQKFEPENIGPKEGEVWDKLVSSEREPYSSEFECGGIVFLRTQGSDAGTYTKASLNKLSLTAEVNFEDTHGQGLLTEALNEKGEWVPPGGAPSLEEAGTAKITY
jgi:hypothetical protein